MTEEIRAGLEAAERNAAKEIDPGARAMVVAIAVLVLLGSFALPHAGSANGWEVLAFAPRRRRRRRSPSRRGCSCGSP